MSGTPQGTRRLRVLAIVVLLLGWELLAGALGSLFFPSFLTTGAAFVQLVSTRHFWHAIWVTHQALLLGFGGALTLGTILGLAMGRWRAVETVCNPYLNLLLATPVSALIPIIIFGIGLGLPARALVVFLFSIAVVVVNTRAGLKTIEPGWIDMARAFGATEMQLWRRIFLPGALPSMMAGWYLGLGRALTGMIAVELLFVAVGIGRLILDYQGMFASPLVYATVGFVVVEAVTLLSALRWLERRLTPWTDHTALE